METLDLETLKYPIGRFVPPTSVSGEQLERYINDIKGFPEDLKKEVANLTDEQLDTRYRPDGWTLRQVVHHCADSHMNSFIRFKLALTENKPTIKPYEEALWAELPDTKEMPINSSLEILNGLHKRWSVLLESFTERELARTYIHPEHNKESTLAQVIANYSWHCKHHLAHITTTKQTYNWR
ncbi:MAG TPA: putative metal-dependent hydrolase [Cytophagaceae bacterium]|jgi:hypothetical protein